MKFKLLKYRTRSYLRSNKATRLNESYKKASTIGLIFTVEDRRKHDHIKALIRKFEHDGKQVSVLAYLPKDQENYEFLFDFFTYREVSMWGNITATSAQQFADNPFDFLLYLDTVPNELIMNVIAQSKAKCRIGKSSDSARPFFEMMIDTNADTKELIDQLFQYVSAIK